MNPRSLHRFGWGGATLTFVLLLTLILVLVENGGVPDQASAQAGASDTVAALEAKVAKMETALTRLETKQQRIAFIDSVRAFEADSVYATQATEMRTKVNAEFEKLSEEFKPEREEILQILRSNTVGEQKWREAKSRQMDAELDLLTQRREIENRYQSEGDAILAGVYRRLRESIRAVCEREGYDIVVNRYGTQFGDGDDVTQIYTALRQNPVLYFDSTKAIDITQLVIDDMNKPKEE